MDVQPMRAASLGVQAHATARLQVDSTLHHDHQATVDVAAILLPPGVRAPALGRTALAPNTPEWRAAKLGLPQWVPVRIPNWCLELLEEAGRERFDGLPQVPGPIDIPVWADPTSGAIAHAEIPQLIAELDTWRDQGIALFRQNRGPTSGIRSTVKTPGFLARLAGSVVGEWREAVGDMVSELKGTSPQRPVFTDRPNAATHPPVEGVDYRTWVTVVAGLRKDEVHPVHVDLYTRHRGVPPGRWPAVDHEWRRRAAEAPDLAAWHAYDVYRLTPTGTTWELGA